MPLPSTPPIDGYNWLTKLDGSSPARFRGMPKMRQSVAVKPVLHHFDGRQWPLSYFGEHTDEKWDVSFIIDLTTDSDQWFNLRTLLDGAQRGNVLVWSDVFGAQFHVIIEADATREMQVSGATIGRFQNVSFTMTRVE